MTDIVRQGRLLGLLGRDRQMLMTDILAVAWAALLPWSTSGTEIIAWLWLIALIPLIRFDELRKVVTTPAGGLPLLLLLFGLMGMLWAFGIPMKERLDGFKSFYKFLFIPLLIFHFRNSERGAWVAYGYIASCCALLVLVCLTMVPGWPWQGRNGPGTPVKDYIAQSGEFIACIFLLAPVALSMWRERRFVLAAGLIVLCAVFMTANVLPAAISRTGLVVAPILLILFACKHMKTRAAALLLSAVLALGAVALSFAPSVRTTVVGLVSEVGSFKPEGERTRAGERLEFWSKSADFIAAAPVVGHGTGSIRDQFRRSVTGETGAAAVASSNPHNQTLAVAIQLGIIGTVTLWAMWLSHIWLFRYEGFAAWAGLMIVAQNVVGSLFNSHLFDFTQGWGYVIGVGVAAGIVLKRHPLGAAADSR